jgi:hypothetical protein
MGCCIELSECLVILWKGVRNGVLHRAIRMPGNAVKGGEEWGVAESYQNA